MSVPQENIQATPVLRAIEGGLAETTKQLGKAPPARHPLDAFRTSRLESRLDELSRQVGELRERPVIDVDDYAAVMDELLEKSEQLEIDAEAHTKRLAKHAPAWLRPTVTGLALAVLVVTVLGAYKLMHVSSTVADNQAAIGAVESSVDQEVTDRQTADAELAAENVQQQTQIDENAVAIEQLKTEFASEIGRVDGEITTLKQRFDSFVEWRDNFIATDWTQLAEQTLPQQAAAITGLLSEVDQLDSQLAVMRDAAETEKIRQDNMNAALRADQLAGDVALADQVDALSAVQADYQASLDEIADAQSRLDQLRELAQAGEATVASATTYPALIGGTVLPDSSVQATYPVGTPFRSSELPLHLNVPEPGSHDQSRFSVGWLWNAVENVFDSENGGFTTWADGNIVWFWQVEGYVKVDAPPPYDHGIIMTPPRAESIVHLEYSENFSFTDHSILDFELTACMDPIVMDGVLAMVKRSVDPNVRLIWGDAYNTTNAVLNGLRENEALAGCVGPAPTN